MDKKFEILNYDELPKWESGKNSGGVNWCEIKEGFIFKISHYKYGYNEFEFVKMDDSGEYLYLNWKGNCQKILKGGFISGKIGSIMLEYKSYKNDKFEIITPLPQTKVSIAWDMIKEGAVIQTKHKQYGYNEFIFIKNVTKDIILGFNGKTFRIVKGNFLQGRIGIIIGSFIKGFQLEIGQRLNDNNRDLTIIDRKYIDGEKVYRYKCNVCGFDCGEHYRAGELNNEFWINERSLRKGTGCSCCYNRSVVTEINSISKVAPWMIELGVNKIDADRYSICNANKIEVICPYCKKAKRMAIHNIYNSESICCSCGDGYSRGHKYIRNILEQLNIEFQENVRIEWCNFYNEYKSRYYQGEYDFIIEDEKLIIEVDGGFHRKDNHLSGQTKEESEFIDAEKDRLAKENGYEVVRIFYNDKYTMSSDDVINSDITKYFNLSKIDWGKAIKFANGNLIKDVCDRWDRRSEDDTTGVLSKEFGLCSVTISKYLMVGAKLGWCNYNKKEELRKNAVRMSKKTSKRVEIFKDEKSLGVFESASNLERQSEEVFGIKLLQSAISSVCLGKKPQYKGFTFKYVENNE